MASSLLASPEADGWGARVDTDEVVMVVGDGGELVLAAVAVLTANERCLPVLFGY